MEHLDLDLDLRLDIGGVIFAVTLPARAWLESLVERYAPFVSSAAPEWRLVLLHDPGLADKEERWIRHSGSATDFLIAGHRGWLDLAQHRAWVTAPSVARAASALDRTLSYVCMQALPREHVGLLLHATGIVMDGRGNVFFGASGTGKTTVAQLLGGRGELLTDENVVVQCGPDGPELVSTPFWGWSTPPDLVRRTRRRAPLRGLYALAAAPAFRLERLSPAAAVLALLTTEKVATERPESATAWLAVADCLIASVPVHRLEFRPTTELWDFLARSA